MGHIKVNVTEAPDHRAFTKCLTGGPNAIVMFALDLTEKNINTLPIEQADLTNSFCAKVRGFSWNDDEQTSYGVEGMLLPFNGGCLRCRVAFSYRFNKDPKEEEMIIHY